MKKALLYFGIFVLLIAGYIIFNTINFSSNQLEIPPVERSTTPEGAIERLVEAIAIRTVSFENEFDFDSVQFQLFNDFIAKSFPVVDSTLEHLVFNQYSHLFKWAGTDPSLAPIILMAHHDVVPIASPRKWSVHPFTEGVKNDTIYGRGTLDDKAAVMAILESIEQLLTEGFQPESTVYLSFGHDEEIGGQRGAIPIAAHLKSEGVKAKFVLDEGSARTSGMIPGLKQEAALIGIAEKGSTTIELRVDMIGGHSSQPEKETAIDVLSNAVTRLKQNPLPVRLTPAMEGFIEKIGPELDFPSKLVFANKGIFKSLLLNAYQNASKAGNAMVRTTTSPTIFEAGIKENVIPTFARAVVNFRIIPGETAEDILSHVNEVINDERVKAEFMGFHSNPSPNSPTTGEVYDIIDKSIKEVFPNILTSPTLVIAATDSRHFIEISDHIYRFTPFKISAENLACFHGIDERIPVSEYADAIQFYRQIVINGSQP